VRAVGSAAEAAVDFRVLAATNIDLAAAVERGAFRSDLHARLAAVELRLPPLRDHVEDLGALCEHLLRRAGLATAFTPDAWEMLARYRWPQNVRELAQVIRAAATVAAGTVEFQHLPERVQLGFRRATTMPPIASRELTRDELDKILRGNGGNLRQTSMHFGIARTRLYRLLKKWSLDPAAYRGTRDANAAEDS
jgi:DNA-binding NtrC family response regulator